MGRLKREFLERAEIFADRVCDVADAVERAGKPRRVVEQMYAAGTAIAANVFEADEAMSRPDFCRCLGISAKELSETRYWLRLAGRRGWVPAKRLVALEDESVELKKVIGAMIANTRRGGSRPKNPA